MRKRKKMTLFALCIAAACLFLMSGYLNGKEDEGDGSSGSQQALLDTGSFWRCRYAWGTDLVRTTSGELAHVLSSEATERKYAKVNGKRRHVYVLRVHPKKHFWGAPAKGWQTPDFNDSQWARLRGPFCFGKYKGPQMGKLGYRSLPLVCLRGKFFVKDPAQAGDLLLSIAYHGGVVIYLNGRELTRKHMPDGEINPDTPAQEYPEKAWVDEKGYLLDKWKAQEDSLRLRTIQNFKITASMLRKGTNVLACEVHRAPAAEVMFTGKMKGKGYIKRKCWWSRVGIRSVSLTVVPEANPAGLPRGLQVWNQSPAQVPTFSDFKPSLEQPAPICLYGAKNGVYSACLMAGSAAPINELKVESSDLSGPGSTGIPASEIQVRYAIPVFYSYGRNFFDGLDELPPSEVKVHNSSAVQPVWITVHVPADAKPGDYRGRITVSAQGQKPVEVLLNLHVVNWTLPDSTEFTTFLDLIQSPDSVAMEYGVPMWSDKHWKLLDKTFGLLSHVGDKTIYITAQRKTHFGNEHGMIRFRKKGDTYEPDFSIAKKYLDLAVSHLGRIPLVCLYCWRAPWTSGNFAGCGPRGDHKILLTVVDPETGKLSKAEGPAWGTPECVEFWKPVVAGIKGILAKHGMAGSLTLGMAGDYTPTDTSLADLDAASGGLKWMMHAHVPRTEIGGKGSNPIGSRKWNKTDGRKYPVRYGAAAWSGVGRSQDPDLGRGYVWKNPPENQIRVMNRQAPRNATIQRLRLESLVTRVRRGGDCGLHGYGRIGADFWKVLKDKRGRKRHFLAGRFRETAWGQLSLRCCGTEVLAVGRNGPVSTIRIEAWRANLQEIEARIFIEKTLADKAKRAKLGEDLAGRAQALLDTRVRLAMKANDHYEMRGIAASDIQGYSEKLYNLAAEVNIALNGNQK